MILIFAKTLQYLKLIDYLGKHIDTFFSIFAAIVSFAVLLVISLAAFAMSFYVLGRNQLQFDKIPHATGGPHPHDAIPYATVSGSWWEIWQLLLGAADPTPYFLGNRGQKVYLISVYVLASFTLLIHLLNMLIAIMSDEFAVNNEIKHKIKIHEQLGFCLEYWGYKKYVFENTLKYIVCAFSQDDEDKDRDLLKNVIVDQRQLKQTLLRFEDQMATQVKEIIDYNEAQAKRTTNIKVLVQEIAQQNKSLHERFGSLSQRAGSSHLLSIDECVDAAADDWDGAATELVWKLGEAELHTNQVINI